MGNKRLSRGILAAAYKGYDAVRKLYWRIAGGRREMVFGEKYSFFPGTHYSSFRGLRLPAGEIFDTSVRYGDYVQTHSAYLYLKSLNRPPFVVEVGAHHGVYATLLGRMVQRKKGKLIAIEPNPGAFSVLKENVRMNNLQDTVVCENIAVTETDGTLRMVAEDEQSRIALPDGRSDFTVNTLTMSSLLRRHGSQKVDLLMIDVEGFELGVLRSIDWNATTIDRIFCELHPYNWKMFGYGAKEFSLFMKERRFRCFDMYLREHSEFGGEEYLGPTIFVREGSE